MSGRFLITGLPRSRTAWFAVATGAYHETISHGVHKAYWPEGCGIADSGAAHELSRWIEAAKPRTLVIERPKADVLASLHRYFHLMAVDWNRVNALLDQAVLGLRYQHPLIRRVAYDDLASLETVVSCLDWLGVKPPSSLEQLMHMNIQSDLTWNLDLLRRKAA